MDKETAMFKKKESEEKHSAYIGHGIKCSGCLEFKGTVYVDGEIYGEIESDGALVLGKGSYVKGRVAVGEFFCDGHVEGDVVAAGKAVLRKNSKIIGTLNAALLEIEEGAYMDAKVEAMDQPVLKASKVLEMKGGEEAYGKDIEEGKVATI